MPTTFAHTGTVDGTWTNAGNWTPGTGPPAAGDSVIRDGRSTAALTGSPATSIQLASIKQYMSCTKDYGTPSTPIICFADNVEVGLEATDGSSGGGAQFHAAPTTNIGSKMVVYNTPSVGTTGLDPVTLQTGTPSSGNHTFQIEGGRAGIATAAPGNIATIQTIVATGGRLNLGAGMVTGWGLTMSGSNPKVFSNSANSGTITIFAGQLTSEGTGLLAAVTIYGGTHFCNHRVSGAASVTTYILQGGTWDYSGDPGGITVTNFTDAGGTIVAATPTQLTITNAPTISFATTKTKRMVSLS